MKIILDFGERRWRVSKWFEQRKGLKQRIDFYGDGNLRMTATATNGVVAAE